MFFNALLYRRGVAHLRNQFAQLNTTLEDYGTRRPVFAGAGHDGLVTPAYLAQAGRRVLVLERRELLGGCSDTEEVWPGYRVSTAVYLSSLL